MMLSHPTNLHYNICESLLFTFKKEKRMSTRTEHDTMGNVEVPSEAY